VSPHPVVPFLRRLDLTEVLVGGDVLPLLEQVFGYMVVFLNQFPISDDFHEFLGFIHGLDM